MPEYTAEELCNILYYSCGEHATMVQMACGHTIVFHTALPMPPIEAAPLMAFPCPYCVLAKKNPEMTPAEIEDLHPHIHGVWKKGAAVIRKSVLTIAEQRSISEMEEDFNGA